MKFKKTIALLTASFSAVSAVLMTAAGAAYQYGASNVLHLQDALLCREELIAADDVDGDGTVNAFDLGILKKKLLEEAGDPVTKSYAATENYVNIIGRNVQKEDVTWLVQSGSAVEFTVTGTSASVQLAGDSGIGNGEDYRPRYAVYVDGELIADTTMSTESETITLFEGSTSRMALVKVMLLSEAMYGGIGVKSVEVTSNAPVPMQPTAENDLLIEFIGDSITCAYGVEGTSSSESFKTTTENFSKSYAYLTAMQLGADYSAVCYSGHGIVSGYSTGDKNADSLVPDVYGQTSKYWEYAEPWDFEKRQNDVVVINLGTNDINYVGAEPETRSQEFIDGYVDFLEQVREYNPEAYIICTMGTMGGPEIYDLVEQAAAQYSEESGDERVMSYFSVTHNFQVDGIGSDWHPSPVTQQNSAYVLADKICQALGMESSQLGLNIAVDSVYTYDSNADSGANVYGYVNDYDKSFWINVMTGGAAASDIQAYIPDLGLKKDGEYRVEFDYTCTAEAEIPLILKGESGTEYLSDSIAPTSEKMHYEAFFTADAAETAELIYQMGGQDNYNLTLYNIKVVKIS
ncbi:MAG: hypothetical protein IJY06_01180 [Oscillospiraceae bacterium]|nr:hypothetical protein [Oscillospiraceae bacterium]MBQ8009927.1 hypothetical protein [Oscillospiraceae bacterium]MBQ9109969.1 hypothetical protein [Oscillospiraceae bacterium]